MKYFMSYFLTADDRTQGWGNCVIERDHSIDSSDEIRLVEALIKATYKNQAVTLMNWRRLEDSE